MGDPDRLQQVFWNLITNAVRFTPVERQRRPCRSRATRRRRHARSARYRRRHRAAIHPLHVRAFRQADAASTRAHGGLGIGLTIVRRLTEMHGGTVSVASEGAGKGATLTVTLPVRRVATGGGRAVGTAPARRDH